MELQAMPLISIRTAITTPVTTIGALMSITASESKGIGKRRCDMCNGRFGLVRHRLGRKQFCCKACQEDYLSCITQEAHRFNRWLEFLASKW